MDQIANWLDQHHVSISMIVLTIVVLIVASIVLLRVNRLLRGWAHYLETRLHLPYETVATIIRLVIATLWLLTGVIVLDIWGVALGGFWTLLVSAATVVGVGFLATWAMVSNVTANLFITLWRPFRYGDTVELLPEKLRGRLIDRNLMFTVLREEGGSVIQVPNNLFFQKIFRVFDGNERSLFEALESKPNVSAGLRPGREEISATAR